MQNFSEGQDGSFWLDYTGGSWFSPLLKGCSLQQMPIIYLYNAYVSKCDEFLLIPVLSFNVLMMVKSLLKSTWRFICSGSKFWASWHLLLTFSFVVQGEWVVTTKCGCWEARQPGVTPFCRLWEDFGCSVEEHGSELELDCPLWAFLPSGCIFGLVGLKSKA